MTGGFFCSLYPEELARIAETGLEDADTTEAEKFFNRNPPEAGRFAGVAEHLPENGQVNISLASDFRIDIA